MSIKVTFIGRCRTFIEFKMNIGVLTQSCIFSVYVEWTQLTKFNYALDQRLFPCHNFNKTAFYRKTNT